MGSRDLTLGLVGPPSGPEAGSDSLLDQNGKYHEKVTGFDVFRVAIGLCKFNCSEAGRSTVRA